MTSKNKCPTDSPALPETIHVRQRVEYGGASGVADNATVDVTSGWKERLNHPVVGLKGHPSHSEGPFSTMDHVKQAEHWHQDLGGMGCCCETMTAVLPLGAGLLTRDSYLSSINRPAKTPMKACTIEGDCR